MLVSSLRPLILTVALLVSGLGVLLAAAVPAAAHSDLVSSSPADGSSTPGRPTDVTLTFNENISDAGLQVVAQGPDGTLALGAPTVSGPVVTVPWPAEAPGGEYQVAYRVVSADGHPIDGSIRFAYADSARIAQPPASSPAAESSAIAETVQPIAATDDSSDFPLWIPAVVVVVGVAIGAVVARALRARRQ